MVHPLTLACHAMAIMGLMDDDVLDFIRETPEYAEAENPQDALMYGQQILFHYFIQTCHYEEREFFQALMAEEGFGEGEPDAAERRISESIIHSLLAFMHTQTKGFMDSMCFELKAVSVEQIREIFRKIFVTMNQEQHFLHMTGTAAGG